LRARKNPGTAIAASNAMIATTIMISTRVKPPWRLRLSVFNMFIIAFVYFDLSWEMAPFRCFSHNSFPATGRANDRRMNRQILYGP
jgi:fatty-acid desaturase